MSRTENLVGRIFNNLKVIEQVSIKGSKTYCYCKCLCGSNKIVKVVYADLKRGRTKSCGCLMKRINLKHGMSNTRIFNIWSNIKEKCYNKTNEYYKYYGEKGITICNEWLNEEKGFLNFYQWAINNGYCNKLYLNRFNTSEDFNSQNCYWSKYIDNGNYGNNKMLFITFKDETHNLTEWSKITGISSRTLSNRIKKDIPVDHLFLSRKELLDITINNKHNEKQKNNYRPLGEINFMIAEKGKMGIYKIENCITHKIYIGSAINIYLRWKQHLFLLNNNKHHSQYLQNSWNKHGGGNFIFQVIEYIEDKNELLKREQYWLDTTKSYNYTFGYNESLKANSPLGVKHTEQSRKNMGKSHELKIVQLKLINNKLTIIKIWNSIKDAGETLGICPQNIVSTCKHKQKTSGGFIWMYESEYHQKAKSLNVPIISEDQFIQMINN